MIRYKFFIENELGTFRREVFPVNGGGVNVAATRKLENNLYYYEKELNTSELIFKDSDYTLLKAIEKGTQPEIGRFDRFFVKLEDLKGKLIHRFSCYSNFASVNDFTCTYTLRVQPEGTYEGIKGNRRKEYLLSDIPNRTFYHNLHSTMRTFAIVGTSADAQQFEDEYPNVTFNFKPDNYETLASDDLKEVAIDYTFVLMYAVSLGEGVNGRYLFLYCWEEVWQPSIFGVFAPWRELEISEGWTKAGRGWNYGFERYWVGTPPGSFDTLIDTSDIVFNIPQTVYDETTDTISYLNRPSTDHYVVSMPENHDFNTIFGVDGTFPPILENINKYWFRILVKNTNAGDPVPTHTKGSLVVRGLLFFDVQYRFAKSLRSCFEYILADVYPDLTVGSFLRFDDIYLLSAAQMKQERIKISDDPTTITLQFLLDVIGLRNIYAYINEEANILEFGSLTELQGKGGTMLNTNDYQRKDVALNYDNKVLAYSYDESYFVNAVAITNDQFLKRVELNYNYFNGITDERVISKSFVSLGDVGKYGNVEVFVGLTKDVGGLPYLQEDFVYPKKTQQIEVNAEMYPQNLLYNFFRVNSPMPFAEMGALYLDAPAASEIAFTKRYVVSIPYCELFDSTDYYKYFDTIIGEGILENTLYNLKSGMLTLTILHK